MDYTLIQYETNFMQFQTSSIELIQAVSNNEYFSDRYCLLNQSKGYDTLVQHQTDYFEMSWEDWANKVQDIYCQTHISFYNNIEILHETEFGVYVRLTTEPQLVCEGDSNLCNPIFPAFATLAGVALVGTSFAGLVVVGLGTVFTLMNAFGANENDVKNIEAYKNN